MSNRESGGAKENARTSHDCDDWKSTSELERELDEAVAKQRQQDEYTTVETVAYGSLLLLSAVSGGLTAFVVVYGSLDFPLSVRTVLLSPIVLLVMIIATPLWLFIYGALIDLVKSALSPVLTVVKR